MDSDHLSEDEEARLYSMLHYVDSSTVISTPEVSDTTIPTDDANKKQLDSNDAPQTVTSNLSAENIVDEDKHTDSFNVETPHETLALQCLNVSHVQNFTLANDKTKRKIAHSKRYWADDEAVTTMYFKVRQPVVKKPNKKLAKAIITLHNTRAMGKRKNSEGCDELSNSAGTSDNHTKVIPPKQGKHTFATPLTTSTPASAKKKNKGKSSKGNVTVLNVTLRNKTLTDIVIAPPKHKANTKRTPLTQRLLENFPRYKTPKKKNGTANTANSESILIDSSDDDDDSVIEVELPDPKETTINLASSDESENELSTEGIDKSPPKPIPGRERRLSPVPSVVSSTSDDFIQADCSTLNITSGATTGPVFNFKLHGSEFSEAQYSNSNTENSSTDPPRSRNEHTIVTSTTRLLEVDSEIFQYHSPDPKEACSNFATPVSKAKCTTKNKNYLVSENSYVVPSADVFESESSDIPESVVEMPIITKKKRRKSSCKEDVLDSSSEQTADSSQVIEMNPIMANVVGMQEPNSGDEEETAESTADAPQEHVDVEAIKGMQCDRDTYYNTIYDKHFDHNKIRSEMPKDKDLWKIDPADKAKPRKMPVQCGYCNRMGHRSETCFKKPVICCMCGGTGHRNTRCPNKICLNCGTSNNTFSVDCKNCKSWKNIYCGTCREHGHPTNRCPDIWRRYHLTVKNEIPLLELKKRKPKNSQFCSGCTKRGHIINDCTNYIQFSNFKPSSPYIFYYTPVYKPDAVRTPDTQTASPKYRTTDSTNKNKLNDSTNRRMAQELKPLSKSPSRLESGNKPSVESPLYEPQQQQSRDSKNRPTTPSPLQKTDEGPSEDSTPKNIKITVTTRNSGSTQKDFFRDVKIVEDVEQVTPSRSNNEVTKSQQNITGGQLALGTDENRVGNLTPTDAKTSLVILPKYQAVVISTKQGKEFLKDLAQMYNLGTNLTIYNEEAALKLTGNVDCHGPFNRDLQENLNSNLSLFNAFPKDRVTAISVLIQNIKFLSKDLGDPKTLIDKINCLKKSISGHRLIRDPSYRVQNWFSKIKSCYRKLNMILIGQAHLKDGLMAFNNINKMLKYLQSQNFVSIGDEMRNDIGQSYNAIFSANPRHDYPELLDMYYKTHADIPNRKNKRMQRILNQKPNVTKKELLKVIRNVRQHWYTLKRHPDIYKCKDFPNQIKKLNALESQLGNTQFSQNELCTLRLEITNIDKIVNNCRRIISRVIEK